MTASIAPKKAIVVPTYDEYDNVGLLIQQLEEALAHTGPTHVMFVDDSKDRRTVQAIELARKSVDPEQLVVDYIHRTGDARTGGLSGAVLDGITSLGEEIQVVGIMDGDLQHPPQRVPGMFDEIEAGHHVVVASRYRKGGSNAGLDGWWRKLVSYSATKLTKALFPTGLRGITDPMTGFFAFRRDQIDMERLRDANGFKVLLELLATHPHLKKSEVPLTFLERNGGDSKAGGEDGVKFLRQLPRLRLATLPPFANFLLGGGLIALLGAVMLAVMVAAGVNPVAANTVQLGVTLALNFVYNKRVTWRGHTNGTLRRQMMSFAWTRGMTLVLSWFGFAGLMAVGARYDLLSLNWRAQAANAACLVGSTLFNFFTSKMIFEEQSAQGRHRQKRSRAIAYRIGSGLLAMCLVPGAIMLFGFPSWLVCVTVVYATFSLVTAVLEVRWRLYGRRTPEARNTMHFPPAVLAEHAKYFFSLIVPALDEPYVIGKTLLQLLKQTHPNVQIVVTLVEGDDATVNKVRELVDQYPGRMKLVVRSYEKGGKSYQLNEALEYCDGDYVGVVDAETVVPAELLAHVEALIVQTNADVVQGGVQLMNLDLPRPKSWNRFKQFPLLNRLLSPFFMSGFWTAVRGWFCVHNVLEYFFWFSSRMFYQADQGFVPLGGNTLFIRRELLNKVGGWPHNLTEDCALGVDLSVEYGAKVVAAYQPNLASREETPSRVFGGGGLHRQRCRWTQGFLSILLEGKWRKLPTFYQRFMAIYILGMPFVQALNGVMLPVALASALLLNAPVGLVMVMFLPFIPMVLSVVIQILGLREFSRDFQQKARLRHYMSLIMLTFVFQTVLAFSALVAVKRHYAGQQNWYKTQHDGAHMDEEVK